MLPGEATKEDGDAASLFGCEGALLGPMEVMGLIQAGDLAQVRAFGLQALLDVRFIIYLDQIRRHEVLRNCVKLNTHNE